MNTKKQYTHNEGWLQSTHSRSRVVINKKAGLIYFVTDAFAYEPKPTHQRTQRPFKRRPIVKERSLLMLRMIRNGASSCLLTSVCLMMEAAAEKKKRKKQKLKEAAK